MPKEIEKLEFGTALKMFRDISQHGCPVNIQKCSFKWKLSYATVKNNIGIFESLGFLKTEKRGREIVIEPTETGIRMSVLFKEIDLILKEGKSCSENSEGKIRNQAIRK